MATYNMTVSPDFSPDHIAGWYIFNTWLQKELGVSIHLELYSNFEAQRTAIARGQVDLIYANPFDAATLVREQGFTAIAAPVGKQDEAVIAAAESSAIHCVEDLKPSARVVMTSDPDVNMIGMIMLEPADLSNGNIQKIEVPSYTVVAKHLLHGKAEVGFFLKEAYDDLSHVIKKELRALVASHIYVVRHVLLAGPRMAAHSEQLRTALLGMAQNPKGPGVLENLGLVAWEKQEQEDTEFMIDLMDTLIP